MSLSTEKRRQQSSRLEAVGRLAAGIVHDFNNLLHAIDAGIHLLEKQLTVDATSPRMGELLSEIRSRTENGSALTRQLLAFSRQQPLSPAPIDLNERLRSLAGMLAAVTGSGVVVDLKLAPDIGEIVIDANQLDIAVLNLAANARHAMAGNGRLTIETNEIGEKPKAAGTSSFVCLTVSDTGCGMSPDVLSRAFEPFFTTKEESEGTGLGLSQVYGFVQQSGGQVRIESSVGSGSSIQLRLPRFAAAED
jgi:signal transduction histidine kinase